MLRLQDLETIKTHSRFRRAFRDESFFPRFWNKEKIRDNRDGLKQILVTWFNENPYQYVYRCN